MRTVVLHQVSVHVAYHEHYHIMIKNTCMYWEDCATHIVVAKTSVSGFDVTIIVGMN